jgi:hypothetical protein
MAANKRQTIAIHYREGISTINHSAAGYEQHLQDLPELVFERRAGQWPDSKFFVY